MIADELGQVARDSRIGGEGQADLLQTGSTNLLRSRAI